MKHKPSWRFILFGLTIAGLTFAGVVPNAAQESQSRQGIPEGVFINLTKDFYRELEKPEKNERVYGTSHSDEYLRQIAVSAKYMVETNLRIIDQQQEMIELLEAIKKKRK